MNNKPNPSKSWNAMGELHHTHIPTHERILNITQYTEEKSRAKRWNGTVTVEHVKFKHFTTFGDFT